MYTIRYFVRHKYTQAIITASFLGLSFFLCFFRKKIARFLEYIVIIYIFAICGVILATVSSSLNTPATVNAFYIGYALALIQRLVGYRILKFRYMVFFHVVSISVKFPLTGVYDGLLCAIVVVLECATVMFNYTAEKGERTMFDATYRAKRETVKFKHLLTEYLPNQMLIVTADTCVPKYFNKAFKRSFRCDNLNNAMSTLDKLVIEPETLQKHQGLFSNFGYKYTSDTSAVKLPEFIRGLPIFTDALRDMGTVNFIVNEEESKAGESMQAMENNPRQIEAQDPTNTAAAPAQTKKRFKWPLISGVVNKAGTILKEGQGGSVDGAKEKSLGDENDSRGGPGGNIDRVGSRSNFSESLVEEGRKRVYKAKIFLLMWDDVEAVALVLDDITKQKTISELRIADKNKDLVIAMVSHELRTPLNAMLGLIDIIKKMLKQAAILPYINACRNNGVLLLSLVNSILDLSQIKNNKLKLIFSRVYIGNLLTEIKSLFEYFCVLKKLYLNIEIDPKIPKSIITDRNRLSQIIINLLGNAFKFTFEGGITLKVELDNPAADSLTRLKFSVNDTGIGIKKEDQDKLFRLFGRLEHEDKRINTSGVGLGLTISNTLVLLLSSQEGPGIQVQSEENKGSSFSFFIHDKAKEVPTSQQITDESLGDLSSTSLEEDRNASVTNKMSAYTLNYLENFTRNINSQNYESKIGSSPEAGATHHKASAPGPTDPHYSIGSITSEDAILLKNQMTNRRKNSNLEIIQDIDSSGKDSSPTAKNLAKRKSSYAGSSMSKNKPWCLIVDDNPFNLMVASHLMEDRGYRIKTALNGKEAIEKVTQHEEGGQTFRVILMDCQMPVMDGYEATRILRMMMNGKEINECPILALTANTRDEDHEKLCLEVGMSGSINKPLQPDELEKMLKKFDESRQN